MMPEHNPDARPDLEEICFRQPTLQEAAILRHLAPKHPLLGGLRYDAASERPFSLDIDAIKSMMHERDPEKALQLYGWKVRQSLEPHKESLDYGRFYDA